MKWSQSYATGVHSVDEQHRMIFRAVGDFREAIDNAQGARSYGVFLEFLHQYVKAHFAHEEKCMKERRCAIAEANAAAHRAFSADFEDFRRRYDAEGFQRTTAQALLDKIETWLTEHICKIDIRLKEVPAT